MATETEALDATVIITAHDEGRVLRPAIRSAIAAMQHPAVLGRSFELLLVLDSADVATRAEASHWLDAGLPFDVRILEISGGDPGVARNAGVEDARGSVVGLLDGDDLISQNFLASAFEVLRSDPEVLAVHPQHVFEFGARAALIATPSMADDDLDHRDLLRHSLWPSAVLMSRELLLSTPYRGLDPRDGYGPEDWVWSIDTVVAGVIHVAAPRSILFSRQKVGGGFGGRHATSLLPAFDLDALRMRLPAPSPDLGPSPTAPSTASRFTRSITRATARWVPPVIRRSIHRLARGTEGKAESPTSALDQDTRDLLVAACAIDPAISWEASRFDTFVPIRRRDDGYGNVLDVAVQSLPDDVSAIIAVQWIGIGGADAVALNYAKALSSISKHRGRTVLLGTFLRERTVESVIPAQVPYVHLDSRFLDLDDGLQRRLMAQLVVLRRPELAMSVNCFHLVHALKAFPQQISDGTRVFATLFAFDYIAPGFPVSAITEDTRRNYLDVVEAILTDNSTMLRRIEDVLALVPPRARVHRQPAIDQTPELDRGSEVYQRERFDATDPFRLVWPHRLDWEKRPEAVVAIAQELRRRGLPAQIDVWGVPVMAEHDPALLKRMDDAGVRYRGPYSGGLPALPLEEYHALLLTSESEGLPLSLVQSLLLGLPVIATRVGGVPDIIVDNRTGLLAEGPDDIDGFADAIERLIDSRDLRRRLIEEGYEFAVAHHSWEAFSALVEETVLS